MVILINRLLFESAWCLFRFDGSIFAGSVKHVWISLNEFVNRFKQWNVWRLYAALCFVNLLSLMKIEKDYFLWAYKAAYRRQHFTVWIGLQTHSNMFYRSSENRSVKPKKNVKLIQTAVCVSILPIKTCFVMKIIFISKCYK